MASNTTNSASNRNADNNEQRSNTAVGQQSKHNLTLGLQGCDSEIANNPLHLQQSNERDIFIRSRIISPHMDDVSGDESITQDDNEIRSISSKQFQSGNSSVVWWLRRIAMIAEQQRH